MPRIINAAPTSGKTAAIAGLRVAGYRPFDMDWLSHGEQIKLPVREIGLRMIKKQGTPDEWALYLHIILLYSLEVLRDPKAVLLLSFNSDSMMRRLHAVTKAPIPSYWPSADEVVRRSILRGDNGGKGFPVRMVRMWRKGWETMNRPYMRKIELADGEYLTDMLGVERVDRPDLVATAERKWAERLNRFAGVS